MTKVFRSFVPRGRRRGAGNDNAAASGEIAGGTGEDKTRRINPATGEVGGPDGPEPTRYGDWERGGICYDF